MTSPETGKKRTLMRKAIVTVLSVCSILAALWGESRAAIEDGKTVWKVSGGLTRAHHQYYDVPAWNCNGSALLIQSEPIRCPLATSSGTGSEPSR